MKEMVVFDEEEIKDYWIENSRHMELVCVDCTKNEETSKLKQDRLLTQSHLEEDESVRTYFCDRCNEKIG